MVWIVLPMHTRAFSTWRLVWADEFDGPAGADVDSSKWSREVGATGWGNNELENYTRSIDNAHLDGNGDLVIRAVRTQAGYTSARLNTRGHYSVTYGRIEARIKVPSGAGTWPAFWMMGDTREQWPDCGEIDIMEQVGREPAVVHATIHGPGYSGAEGITAQFAMPNGEPVANDFHVYALDWEPDLIRWYIDSHLYHVVSRANVSSHNRWVFDAPFYLLLNLAVGGNLAGPVDAQSPYPKDMIVDYVRVWERIT